MFFGNGTGNGGDDWEGLSSLVGSTGTVGGIDATDGDNSWWRSAVTNQGSSAITIASMATLYNNCSVGNDQPTICITGQNQYEAYEALLTTNVRYTDTDVANAGFQNLMFKGCPITFDGVLAGEGKLYFLNTKYLQLVAHSDVWFKPTPFVRPTNQDAVFSQLLCYGELTTSNRARQGYMYGITPA